MRSTRGVRAADVQRLLSMVIDVCTGPASPTRRKQSLVVELCRTFRARVGEIVEVAEGPQPLERRFVSFIDAGWDSPEQAGAYVERSQAMSLTDPLSEHVFARSDEAFNIRREDIVADGAWYGSAYVNEVLKPSDLDSVLGCYRRFRIDPAPQALEIRGATEGRDAARFVATPCAARMEDDRSSVSKPTQNVPAAGASRVVGLGIGLHRSIGDAPFTSRDVALLSHFNRGLERLYPAILFDEDEHIWLTLPRRVRCVLDLLLEGLGDKAIARRLNLSQYTVQDYARDLYRRFGVDGRSALLARLLGRSA